MKGQSTDVRAILEGIAQAVVDLDEGEIIRSVKKAIDMKISPLEVIENGLAKGLREVGRRFEVGQYFLPELVTAANLMKTGTDMLNPYIGRESTRRTCMPRVLMGTVKGDIHDIGKNIVSILLEANGFEVIDLGFDVPTDIIVENVKEHAPDIVGLSALLTVTLEEMRNVVDALKKAGLRERVKVMIGGAPTSQRFADEIGADAYGIDANDAVEKAKALMVAKGGGVK